MNYNVTLSEKLDRDLEVLTRKLGTSPDEVIRKAIVLLKHASNADEVKLINNGKEQKVLVK